MNDEAAQRPLAHLTTTELQILDRVATRYSRTVAEHAALLGVMNLAIRRRDWMLFAKTKKRLEQTAQRCNECYCALKIVREELEARDGNGSAPPPSASEYRLIAEPCQATGRYGNESWPRSLQESR